MWPNLLSEISSHFLDRRRRFNQIRMKKIPKNLILE